MTFFRIVFVARVFHCEVARSHETYVARARFMRSYNPFSTTVRGVNPASAPRLQYASWSIDTDHGIQRFDFRPEAVLRYNSQPNPANPAEPLVEASIPFAFG